MAWGDQFSRNASASIYLGSNLFREVDLLSFSVKEGEKSGDYRNPITGSSPEGFFVPRHADRLDPSSAVSITCQITRVIRLHSQYQAQAQTGPPLLDRRTVANFELSIGCIARTRDVIDLLRLPG